MSTVAAAKASYAKPSSITLIRMDPLPNLPSTVTAKERIDRLERAVALVAQTGADKDKFRPDITTQQAHTKTFKPTNHPVARGATISDHVVTMPQTLVFTGMITDTPFSASVLGGDVGIKNRVHNQIRQLDEFADKRDLLFVASSYRTYENMLITRLVLNRDPNTGAAAIIQLTLQQIKITSEVQTQSIPTDSAAQLGAFPVGVGVPSSSGF